MAQITVTVVRADTNQEYEVELPDNSKLDDLLPQLVQQLGLPLVGPDGNRISYQLSNKRTSQELKQNKSLAEYGTKNGDMLLLTSTFVAGNDRRLEPASRIADFSPRRRLKPAILNAD